MRSPQAEDFRFEAALDRWKRRLVVNVRWLTRTSIVFVFVFVLLHQLHLPVVEHLSEFFGLAEPSLAGILVLILAFFIVERVVVLEDRLGHPPVLSFETRVEAYRTLSNLVRERGAKRVDLLQFSGQTALPLLRDLAETWPQAQVRLLLHHPEEVVRFDEDGRPHHAERISTAIEQIRVIEEDYGKFGFHVNISYYRAPASVSTVVVDGDLVAIGWYYAFFDKSILRLRGHNAPTVLAQGADGKPLRDFASRHFESLMASAEAVGGKPAPDASHPASITSPGPAEVWKEFFHLGDALAASDTPASETLTAAVLAMRR